jgi:Fe2+ or Zn2+ uptake regulation protein
MAMQAKRDPTADLALLLRGHGIQPSAQRVAIAGYVLGTAAHPSADQVLERVRASFPMVSRATVYNTLHLLVEKGLLRELVLAEGKVVYDPKLERHHHFVDEESGAIHDIPWGALQVSRVGSLAGYDVREYQVVLRGRRRGAAPRHAEG